MKKIDKVYLKNMLQWFKDMKSEVNIEELGDYRQGLTFAEIRLYLALRVKTTNLKKINSLYAKFWHIAGPGNTMAIGPQGQPLMYRRDVKRFADALLLGKETYFD